MEDLKLDKDGKVILPQPDQISKKEKEDAMGAYLMMFAAMGAGLPLPLLNMIAAIVYFFVNKKQSRFVAYHSFQSLITQIPISIINAGLLFWTFWNIFTNFNFSRYYFIFLIFAVLWNLIYTVYSIIACVKAKNGKLFYMLLFGRIAFIQYYGPNSIKNKKKPVNTPPPGL